MQDSPPRAPCRHLQKQAVAQRLDLPLELRHLVPPRSHKQDMLLAAVAEYVHQSPLRGRRRPAVALPTLNLPQPRNRTLVQHIDVFSARPPKRLEDHLVLEMQTHRILGVGRSQIALAAVAHSALDGDSPVADSQAVVPPLRPPVNSDADVASDTAEPQALPRSRPTSYHKEPRTLDVAA